MNILIIGSGGREHALAWKLRQSPMAEKIFAAPGNGGTASIAENIPVKDSDITGLVDFAKKNGIGLVVPGPELPLTLGITDAMEKAGIPCFGPCAACARLEGSKAFAKEIMRAAKVPTADAGIFTDLESAKNFVLAHNDDPLVVKADGLAAGKGVIITRNSEEALAALDLMFKDKAFGNASDTVLIEEFLEGEEVSLLCFCDGKHAVPLPSAQDHKRVFDGDQGPNTGGMGAYSPAPILPDNELENMTGIVIRPVLAEMERRGTPFKGILYAGLMMTASGPKVLEYNVRFGDPECQPLMMRLSSDLAELMLACCRGTLDQCRLSIDSRAALGIVLSSRGYPGSYPKGMLIGGIEEAEKIPGAAVFQAGTRKDGNSILANGGRVLCATALGEDLAVARRNAYSAMEKITMENKQYRNDIGQKGLRRLGLAD